MNRRPPPSCSEDFSRILLIVSYRVLSVIAVFLLSACQHSLATYPTDDALRKGEAIYVPQEFLNGTASVEQAKAWSNSLLEGDGSIVTEQHELTPGGKPALFISDSSNAGTGGNFYMVFDRTVTGLRYLGEIEFGDCRAVRPDASNNPRLVTYWHLGAGEGNLTLWLLSKQGFTAVKSITIHPGDQGTDEGNRIFDAFFGSEPVADGTVDAAFAGTAAKKGL
jgi:hypothetical protein